MNESKFDPLLNRVRESDLQSISPSGAPGQQVAQVGGGDFAIPQLDADPASPSAESAWVLKSTSAGGGGKLMGIVGLMTPVATVGAPTTTYRFSYRTLDGTTKRVTLS